ncbi:MAG: hypothetical protein JSV51_06985 [Candidatus Bathyarchaeota archaeon]|nr:MAG: hypothetical protein JSV51_06985 [Candidatus Bathyarchaeota archaeon]
MGRAFEAVLGVLVNIVGIVVKCFSWVARKLEDHYDGRLAGLPQTVFALGVTFTAFSPFVIYTILLALRLTPPYSYIGFALWIAFVGAIMTGAAYMDYTRGQATMDSLSKDFTWDIEQYTKDYMDLLENKQTKRQKNATSNKVQKSEE